MEVTKAVINQEHKLPITQGGGYKDQTNNYNVLKTANDTLTQQYQRYKILPPITP
jgi:hypothetical protein